MSGKISYLGRLFSKRALLAAVLMLAAAAAVWFGAERALRMRERRRAETRIAEIEREIFERQCSIDRIYCCSGGRKESCADFGRAGCLEADGSNEVDCALK